MTKVLLAEDDPAISDPLARALRREGYDVDVCTDGESALSVCSKTVSPPGSVIRTPSNGCTSVPSAPPLFRRSSQ